MQGHARLWVLRTEEDEDLTVLPLPLAPSGVEQCVHPGHPAQWGVAPGWPLLGLMATAPGNLSCESPLGLLDAVAHKWGPHLLVMRLLR